MSFKQKFRQIKKFPDWVFAPLAWFLFLVKFLMRTSVRDPENQLKTRRPPAVTVTWHNRLLFFPLMFPKRLRKLTVAVISASRDGQYVVDLVKQMGVGSLRGSSCKKGVNALHGAFAAIRENKFVAFTPDGPRGPCCHMSLGPVFLSSQTGVPVIPIAINYSSYWQLRSWDGFRIPKPWAKVELVVGSPVVVPAGLGPEGLEEWRLKLEKALNDISEVKP